jgi:hypothetical protein
VEELLFFDIEVFKYNALIIFKDIDNRVVRSWHNAFNGLEDFITGKVIVGYNNFYYDNKILTGMIKGYTPQELKELNDDIIVRGMLGPKVNERIRSLDCFQQIDVSKPGLKKIEGNMGRSIIESAVPFDIDRPLTAEEFQEVYDYCCYDIETTIEIYKLREKGYFQSKELLVEMLPEGLRDKARSWNTTTIAANILKPNAVRNADFVGWHRTRVPEEIWDYAPAEVQEFFEQINTIGMEPKDKTLTIRQFDCDIQFGFGGLHGVHVHKKRVENVKLLDVASMYPNIILNIGALGEEGSKIYQGILDRRIAIKHIDKIMSDALKLILNSAYGNLNNKYSILNNPKAAYSVCFYGQIALYELCRRLHEAGCTIININTDGVGFTAPDEVGYKMVWKGWEQDFSLDLEEDNFDLFVQRDVNNYIGKFPNGKLKCKGGDVNRYLEPGLFKNNNARILDMALVNHVIHGVDVLDTLIVNLDKPELYQYILKAGGTYKGICDREGNEYQKVNRVFAVKKDGVCLMKKRHDDGLVHFPDTPENMLVWNRECSELENFAKVVDLNHYYSIIKKRLEKWV